MAVSASINVTDSTRLRLGRPFIASHNGELVACVYIDEGNATIQGTPEQLELVASMLCGAARHARELEPQLREAAEKTTVPA